MRQRVCILLVTLVCLIWARPIFAQSPVASAADSVRWDYVDAELVSGSVLRFEICFDALVPCASVTPAVGKFTPTTAQGGTPALGVSAYKLPFPALVVGAHAVIAKACNVDVCSLPTSPFAFRLAVVPTVPINLQLIKGG